MADLPKSPPQVTPQQFRALLRDIDAEEVRSFADISGDSPALAVAVWEKYACPITLVALNRKGAVEAGAGDWIDTYRAKLIGAGVPQDKIHVVTRKRQLHDYDLVAALNSYGVTRRINNLGWALRRMLNGQSRLLVDVRKGSGGYPFLRRFGNATSLAKWESDDRPVNRVVLSVEPSKSQSVDMQWGRIATELVGDTGFFETNDTHSFTYIKRGGTLCVTFDNLDIAMNNRDDRRPWGFKFIEDQGWSMLAVMAGGWTWYRDPYVTQTFDQLRDDGFFAGFERVIFYGASMGAYGALAFSAAHPGSDVVVFSPQTVLDKSLVPWETRYRVAWDADWSDHYGDAAKTVRAARRVSLFYDPYSPLDAGHIKRLSGDNLHHYRAPFLGHRLGSSMQQMGILQPLVLSAMEGTLTGPEFYKALRTRTGFRRYRKEIVNLCLDRGHPDRAERLCRHFLKDGEDAFFRQTLERIRPAAA